MESTPRKVGEGPSERIKPWKGEKFKNRLKNQQKDLGRQLVKALQSLDAGVDCNQIGTGRCSSDCSTHNWINPYSS